MPKPRFDPSRRHSLTGRCTVAPPLWADRDRFHDTCTRCGACAAACPKAILVTDSGYPSVNFLPGGRGRSARAYDAAGAARG